jgi:hypothetical protein
VPILNGDLVRKNIFVQPSIPWILLKMLVGVGLAVSAGCESMRTVIVDVDFDVQLQVRDSSGRLQRAAPEELVKKRHPQAASPFPNTHYEGKLFEWRISVSDRSLGYLIRSNSNGPVCFRFDEAQIASNFQPQEVPLRITWARYGSSVGEIQVRRSMPGEQPYAAPPVCAPPEKGATFGFVPDYSELFPNGQVFNINQAGKSLNYSEHGAKNWLKIRMPIEYDDKREELEVIFTGNDSKARFSYY